MIVVGIDPHMKTHTAVAVDTATGARISERTVACDAEGHDTLLVWARSLDDERRFAIEDCRHVSGRLERYVLPRGEAVVRVPPKLMAGARASARTYGTSDRIDAACVARAALREPDLPRASLPGAEHEVRLLVDHRDDLVGECARIQKRLRWNCHDPEIREYMRVLAPELIEIPGCSAISAGDLIAQTARASRFRDEAAFAMHVGTAPLPVSSGKSGRYRLNRTGNRTPTSVIHVIAVTQVRMHPPAITFIERKRAEGMSNREALRCLERHIGRAIYKMMVRAEKARVASVVRIDFPPSPVAVAV